MNRPYVTSVKMKYVCGLALLLTSAAAFSSLPLTLQQPGSMRSGTKSIGGVPIPSMPIKRERLVVFLSGREQPTATTNTNERTNNNATENSFTATTTIASPIPPSSSFLDNQPDWVAPAFWRGSVVVLCALWASNFAAVKIITDEPGVDSSLYALTRFGVAALALIPGALNVVLRNHKNQTPSLDWETTKAAVVCGSWVAFGYLGQTLGLLTTTASRSCVICSLHCVFVALVAEAARVKVADAADDNDNNSNDSGLPSSSSFDLQRLVPAAVAVVGVAIIELQGAAGPPVIGDALSLAQPIGFGIAYLQLEKIMIKRPDMALPVSAIKLTVVALASLVMYEITPLFQHTIDATTATTTAAASTFATDMVFRLPDVSAVLTSPVARLGILYTGLVTTALGLWVESIAFARVPATDASLILTTEPLFAAVFGAVTLGETFGVSDYAGASMIIGACALAVLLDASPGNTNTAEECELVVHENENCSGENRSKSFWAFFL